MNWQEQAKELWGDRIVSGLSPLARVSKRTVQRWLSGQNAIPEAVERKVDKTYQLWLDER